MSGGAYSWYKGSVVLGRSALTWSKEVHRQVGMDWVIAPGSLGSVMVIVLRTLGGVMVNTSVSEWRVGVGFESCFINNISNCIRQSRGLDGHRIMVLVG